MKTTLSLAVLFVLALGGGYTWYAHSQSSYSSASSDSAVIAVGNETPAVSSTSQGTTESSGKPVISPTSLAVANTAISAAAQTGSYTSTQVAAHGKSGDCWSSINASVYNLTAWISQHPGGEGPILSICGKDGSAAFNGQHGDNGRAKQALALFKVGSLVQ